MKMPNRNAQGMTRPGPGRRLDESRDPVILQAVLEGLAEVGYDKLTMDMIALRAHAGKGALYRRWSSKAELVISAITARHETLDIPDTGSLYGDFSFLLESLSTMEGNTLMRSVFSGLATAASRNADLATAFRSQLVGGRMGAMEKILQRAAKRGEIEEGRDFQLILEIIPAFFFSQAVLEPGGDSPGIVRRLITEIIYPLLTVPHSSQWPEGSFQTPCDSSGPAHDRANAEKT